MSPGVFFNNRVGGGASQGFYYGDPGAKTLIQALGPTASSAQRVGDIAGDVVGAGEPDENTAYKGSIAPSVPEPGDPENDLPRHWIARRTRSIARLT